MILTATIMGLVGYVLRRLFMPPRFHQKIAEDVGIPTDEWTVLPIEPDVEIKYQIQQIDLSVANARMNDDGEFVHLPDGTLIDARVEVQDRDGNWHRLEAGSFGVSPDGAEGHSPRVSRISFQLEHDLPRDTRFTTVRLRATQSFTCSRIGWHCWNMK